MSSFIKHLKRNIGAALFGGLGVLYKSCCFLPQRCTRMEGLLAPSSEIKNILVVELLKIGDTVVAMPTITALRRIYPKAKITVVVQPLVHPLFEANRNLPSVADEVVTFDNQSSLLQACRLGKQLRRRLSEQVPLCAKHTGRQKKRFDLAVVLDISFKSNLIAFSAGATCRIGYNSYRRGFLLTNSLPAPMYWNRASWEYPEGVEVRHQVHSWLMLLSLISSQFNIAKLNSRECQPNLCVSAQSRDWVVNFLSANCIGSEDLVVSIHPGSDPAYRWRSDRFAAVADFLAGKHDAKIVITGGPHDVEIAVEIRGSMRSRAIIAAGKTSLMQMAALLERANLLISVDTCATHIASAVGTRVVALFGPGDPRIWQPYGEEHEVVRDENCECLGCKNAKCQRSDHLCMDSISVDDVLRAAERLLLFAPVSPP